MIPALRDPLSYNTPIQFTDLLSESERDQLETEAACKGSNVNAFYPENRGPYIGDTLLAIEVCQNECPVREFCILASLENPREQGVWGGYNERSRHRLRKEARYLQTHRGFTKKSSLRKVVRQACM